MPSGYFDIMCALSHMIIWIKLDTWWWEIFWYLLLSIWFFGLETYMTIACHNAWQSRPMCALSFALLHDSSAGSKYSKWGLFFFFNYSSYHLSKVFCVLRIYFSAIILKPYNKSLSWVPSFYWWVNQDLES